MSEELTVAKLSDLKKRETDKENCAFAKDWKTTMHLF